MKQSLKVKISNLSTWIMISTVGLIVLWFIGFIISNTFNLNVFASKTTEFFISLIGFALVLIICMTFLNISLNISLIAESKIKDLKIDETHNSFFNKRFLYVSSVILIALIGFMFIGDYLTRKNEKRIIETEAIDLVERSKQSIDELTILLNDTSTINQVPEILKMLSNQKAKFPTVSIITSDKYKNELIYLEIDRWTSLSTLKKPYFDYSFYKCDKAESDYLRDVFENRFNGSYTISEKNDYKFYYPFENNGRRIVLLFTKYERYGKIGS